jgi:type VI secretion system secreted protein VgrG
MIKFDTKKFAIYLVQHKSAKQFGEGRCAHYVRLALAAAGLKPVTWPQSAKYWGGTLLALGFTTVNQVGYIPETGDIVVIQPPAGDTNGHIAGYDGKNWVSDFVQREMWPGPAYRAQKPAYVIFRYAH